MTRETDSDFETELVLALVSVSLKVYRRIPASKSAAIAASILLIVAIWWRYCP